MASLSRRLLLPFLLSLALAGCATTDQPAAPQPTAEERARAEQLATAKRFLHSWGAGELALETLRRTSAEQARTQPAAAEMMNRIAARISPDDFETAGAEVYARHLELAHLQELARFAESAAGNRFFRQISEAVLAGKKVDGAAFMNAFSSDELLELMKFSKTPAFAALQRELPAINRELAEAGRRLGEQAMQQLLREQR